MTNTLNKERTSISIDPELLAECKNYCKTMSLLGDKKLTFSKLVTQALNSYVKVGETPLVAKTNGGGGIPQDSPFRGLMSNV